MSVAEKTTVDLRGRLDHLNKTMAKALEQAGPTYDFSKVDDDVLEGASPAEKLEKFQQMDREANELGEELDRRGGFEAAGKRIAEQGQLAPHPGHANGTRRSDAAGGAAKTFGTVFAEDNEVKAFSPNTRINRGVTVPGLRFDAATFDTAGATLTGYERPPGMVLLGQRRLTVADLLAQGQTTQPTVRYVREDTFTNAATSVAEGATKPEASWDTSEVDAPVRKIAVTSKVTDELFADFTMIRDYIDQRMRFMVVLTEEDQLLNGNGTAPNLRGILNTSGILTQAKGADNGPDAIFKGIMKVLYTGFFDPDGVVINPTDWQGIRLLKTADGLYVWGAPSDEVTPRLWGRAAVVTPSIAAGTALVGAFRLGAQVWYREGLRVESTNANEDDFKKNLIAIRAEQREALAVYLPTAFATVTGL
jgi:HK97 family phage major capsid protein